MDTLISEHGEVFIYGIVGVLLVFFICTICVGRWQQISPSYKTKTEKSNAGYRDKNQDKCPIIETDEIIYADYQNKSFDFHDFISARDWDGTDLTGRIKIYGNVNVFQKGIYKLRCVVVSDSQLICTKYVNVIVE